MAKTDKNGERKKLSWIYRKKSKLQKFKKSIKNVEDNVVDDKKPRIIVRNVPFKATIEDVKKLYEPFGEIVDIHFPQRADGTLVGCCFVQFKLLEEASKAIFNTNKINFLGRVISSSWVIPKSKYCEKLQKELTDIKTLSDTKEYDKNKEKVRNNDKEYTNNDDNDRNKAKGLKPRLIEEREDPSKEETRLQIKREKRKLLKEKNRLKRARIVIRNLAFQATVANLQEHFSQYGAIEEVKILKREDGKSVGCAFVQFKRVQSATKAIHYSNLKLLLNRPIIVDWAIPKNKFTKNDSENIGMEEVKVNVKKEPGIEDHTTSGEELSGERSKHNINGGFNFEDDDLDEIELEDEEEDEEEDEDEDEDENQEAGTSEDDQDEDKQEIKEQNKNGIKRPRVESHDVSEGRTVFLKNIPFSVKNEELKKYMERFGPVYYALVCIDPLTEFSKGTGFVKFKYVDDAEKCLLAGNELQMDDQVLEAHRALDKNELEKKENSKQHKQRDSRNLYLVKEGVVLAGSSAAAGVSTADMAKRLQIEQWKSQILRNFNMFVSRVRLVVHNLPSTLNDVKLRKIFERYSPPTAIIREVRVMRDLKNVDINGVGKSKEYAFVSFTKHEDALQALRSINNNPDVFSPNRRPIVSFSIENRVLVNAKQKRLQKSRENNPCWAGNKMKRKGKDENERVPTKLSRTESLEDSSVKPYTGMIGKRGESKLRSKYNLKTQAILHGQAIKKEKKLKKSSHKAEMRKIQKIVNKKEVRPKQNMKIDSDDVNLDKLVNKYKNKLQSTEMRRSKWYES